MFPCSVNKQQKIKLGQLPACSKFNWKIMNCRGGPLGVLQINLFFLESLHLPLSQLDEYKPWRKQNVLVDGREGMRVDGLGESFTACCSGPLAWSVPRFPPSGWIWPPGGCWVPSASAVSIQAVYYQPSLKGEERRPWKWRSYMIYRSEDFRQIKTLPPQTSCVVTNNHLRHSGLIWIKGISKHLAICFLDLIAFPGAEVSSNDLLLKFMASQEKVWIISEKQKDFQKGDRKETASGSPSHGVEGRCLPIGLEILSPKRK